MLEVVMALNLCLDAYISHRASG